MVFITVSAYLQLFLVLLAKGSERELATQLWEPGGAAVYVTPVTHPRLGWPDSDDHQRSPRHIGAAMKLVVKNETKPWALKTVRPRKEMEHLNKPVERCSTFMDQLT